MAKLATASNVSHNSVLKKCQFTKLEEIIRFQCTLVGYSRFSNREFASIHIWQASKQRDVKLHPHWFWDLTHDSVNLLSSTFDKYNNSYSNYMQLQIGARSHVQ